MYQAILFLPLVGALFAGALGPFTGPRPAEVVTTTLVLITALLSWLAFYEVAILGQEERVALMQFITSGDLKSVWSLRIDTLTAVMLVVVNTISSLVHLYSIG
jgi:NADH-quinone oxidoreductase subunit L